MSMYASPLTSELWLIKLQAAGTACQRCAPRAPEIHWIKRAGKLNKIGGKTKSSIVAFEDKLEAGRYEHVSLSSTATSADDEIGSQEPSCTLRSPTSSRQGHRLFPYWSQHRFSRSSRSRSTPCQHRSGPFPGVLRQAKLQMYLNRLVILPSNKRDPEMLSLSIHQGSTSATAAIALVDAAAGEG